ncbi:MAG: MMPL family transporter, partial [Proteobacteria bacterium]|nr:MMPL family transporter [Pseudomonadota bacterium]
MNLFARLLSNHHVSWGIIAVTLVLGVVAFFLAANVEQEDDVLAFLPEGNAEIETFYEINEQFGGLDVALVGIEAVDPFNGQFLAKLKEVTRDIGDTPGVETVLSLANVEDFVEDPIVGGIVASQLVDSVPNNVLEEAALREKVMARDFVVGNLISEDAHAVMIYVFAAYGAQPRELANRVRDIVDVAFPENPKYWGGSPFIATYIYDSTQADMARLTPWAVVAIVIIILASFRDWVGSALALGTTAMGIVISRAAMAVLGVSFNIVLSAMPVILFAVGSAYSIHMLSRYYAMAAEDGREKALHRVVVETAPVVLAAGLTTVAGLLSFVMMDIRPMRTFGIFTAVGIFSTLVLSVTFVPAVLRVIPMRGPEAPTGALRSVMMVITHGVRRWRWVVGGILVAVACVGVTFVGQVDNRMDQSTFFSPGSPPDLAERFLFRHFGGSQFLQVQVVGDFEDPHVLREMRRLSDRMVLIDKVTSVLHAGEPVATVNDAMAGLHRIPDKARQVRLLYRFLQGNAAVGQLVTGDRDQGLLHIKIGSNQADDLDAVLAAVEKTVANEALTKYRIVPVNGEYPAARERLLELLVARVRGLAKSFGVSIPTEAEVEGALSRPVPLVLPQPVEEALTRFLLSEECFVVLDPVQAAAVARLTVSLGPAPHPDEWSDGLMAALAEVGVEEHVAEMMAMDLTLAAGAPLESMWREAKAAQWGAQVLRDLQLTIADTPKGERFRKAVAVALIDDSNPMAMLPAEGAEAKTLEYKISGLPVLYNGMSRSVTSNQLKSLAIALFLVFFIMTLLFRSPATGLLATLPTALTLVVVYGGMGYLGVHLDIG